MIIGILVGVPVQGIEILVQAYQNPAWCIGPKLLKFKILTVAFKHCSPARFRLIASCPP